MKIYITILVFVCVCLAAVSVIEADKTCSAPPYARPGHWAGRDRECVALIQAKCPGVGLTRSWRRGTKVKDNCGSIRRYTAIATFEGPNNAYNTPGYRKQHTGIFVSCDAAGITVFDQYRKSGGVKQRVLRYGGSGVNDGNLFYTIL